MCRYAAQIPVSACRAELYHSINGYKRWLDHTTELQRIISISVQAFDKFAVNPQAQTCSTHEQIMPAHSRQSANDAMRSIEGSVMPRLWIGSSSELGIEVLRVLRERLSPCERPMPRAMWSSTFARGGANGWLIFWNALGKMSSVRHFGLRTRMFAL